MNKKAILRELLKDPEIKALYKQGFSRSVVNKLIIEGIAGSEKDAFANSLSGGKQAAKKLTALFQQTANKAKTEEEVTTTAKEVVATVKSDPDLKSKEKEQAVRDIFQIAKEKLDSLGINSASVTMDDYKKFLESEEFQAVKKIMDQIKEKFDKNPERMQTFGLDMSDIKSSLNLSETQEEARGKFEGFLEFLNKLKGIIEKKVTISREAFINIYETLFKFEEKVEDLTAIVVQHPNKEVQALTVLNKVTTALTTTMSTAITTTNSDSVEDDQAVSDKEEEPEQVKDNEKTTLARESYDKAYVNSGLGSAFNEYEEVFGTTPYLKDQSKVLFDLESALQKFKDGIEVASIKVGGSSAKEKINEESETGIVDLDVSQRRVFIQSHKKMSSLIKELVMLISSLNEKNLTTLAGSNIRKQSRSKAKELLDTLATVLKELVGTEGKTDDQIEFSETLDEAEKKAESKTDHVKRAHQQILSNMTKVDRITRSEEDRDIDKEKYFDQPVEGTLEIIKEISPYFPIKAPFGKTGDLSEIKRQVKGISRDVIDVLNKIKGFATSKKTKVENIDRLRKTIVGAVSILEKYFDIEIKDPEIRAMLPEKPKTNAAAFNDGADELKSKIDSIIEKYGKTMSKVLNKKTLSNFMKVKEFISKKLKDEFGNKIPPLLVAKQIPEVEAEYIDEMEVITKFVNFMVKMSEDIVIKESLGDFLKNFEMIKSKSFGKQLSKQFTKTELETIKHYLSKSNQLTDLVNAVKIQQNKSLDKIPTFQGKGSVEVQNAVEDTIEDLDIDSEDDLGKLVDLVVQNQDVQRAAKQTNTSDDEVEDIFKDIIADEDIFGNLTATDRDEESSEEPTDSDGDNVSNEDENPSPDDMKASAFVSLDAIQGLIKRLKEHVNDKEYHANQHWKKPWTEFKGAMKGIDYTTTNDENEYVEFTQPILVHKKHVLERIKFFKNQKGGFTYQFRFKDPDKENEEDDSKKLLALTFRENNKEEPHSGHAGLGTTYEESPNKVLESLEKHLKLPPEGWYEKLIDFFTRKAIKQEQIQRKLETIIEHYINNRKR